MTASLLLPRIRLAGIDAPERKQAFGEAPTRRLAKNATFQVVTVEIGLRGLSVEN